MDTILNADDMGATVLNYVEAVELNQEPDQTWSIRLQDTLDASTATVTGRLLVNTAGPWVDRVLARTGVSGGEKHLIGIKGVNLMVQLHPEGRGQGLEHISSIDQPFHCMPLGAHDFFGPTDTVFEGEPPDARVTPIASGQVIR